MTAERAPAQHEDAPILENQLTTRAFTEARPRGRPRCGRLRFFNVLRPKSAWLFASCCGTGLRGAWEKADSVNAPLETFNR